MSEAKREASPASAFTPETALYELGRKNAAGEPLFIRVRAVPRSKIAAFFNGIPTKTADGTADKAAEAKNDAAWREMMRAGVIEPAIRFSASDPGDGLLWDDLDMPLQLAIQNAMLEQSGMKLPEEANALATFRAVERGGVPVRAGGDGAMPPATDAG